MAEILKAEGVGKVFPGGLVALDGFDLDVDGGDFVALVGPSGCGKTTFLRMAAGFEFPTGGQLLFRGQRIAGPDPRRAVPPRPTPHPCPHGHGPGSRAGP